MKHLLAGLLLTALSAACSTNPTVELGGKEFDIRVADTPRARQLGLMYVQSMAPTEGMLFIFPDEKMRSFWMKNTLIALDILYFTADRKLVSMQLNALPCRADPCRGYPSAGPAKYVLELNAGVGKSLNLNKGDLLDINL